MTTLDDLRSKRRLQDVPVDPHGVDRLLSDARQHLVTASMALRAHDRAAAYQIGYDAARKALTAMLLSRGLRAHGVGTHVTLFAAVRLAFEDVEELDIVLRFDRVRRTRNEAEYFGREFDDEEVEHDLGLAAAVVALAERVIHGEDAGPAPAVS